MRPGNGWGRRRATHHEHGHARVAEALGCQTRFEFDAHGVPIATEIVSGPPLTAAEHIAITLGCGDHGDAAAGDDALIERRLRRVPRRQRAAVMRDARRINRRHR